MTDRLVPAKGWEEEDLFNSPKGLYHWRPGKTRRIKRRHRRKERQAAKRELKTRSP